MGTWVDVRKTMMDKEISYQTQTLTFPEFSSFMEITIFPDGAGIVCWHTGKIVMDHFCCFEGQYSELMLKRVRDRIKTNTSVPERLEKLVVPNIPTWLYSVRRPDANLPLEQWGKMEDIALWIYAKLYLHVFENDESNMSAWTVGRPDNRA